MKKNFFLHFSLKNKKFYKIYLFYNLYIRNLKYYLKKSYSQFDEDIFLKEYFKNKKKGFFIDIGCHHPFKANNTFLLYKSGWSGINIDLNKISIDLFNVARPRDINICTAISNKDGIIEYYLPDNNPLSSEITINKNFSKILKDHHGNKYQALKTKSITWRTIEEQYDKLLKSVDILKIDIEGSDLKVLKTIDLIKLNPKLLMVEASNLDISERDKIISYLKLNSYKILYDNKLNVIFSK
ncbi:FkbM family methyltransferase [Pelagibacteraceae bacterium]|nr:FkbM family methyltransferase [Pelagibacteraceae bacterium]